MAACASACGWVPRHSFRIRLAECDSPVNNRLESTGRAAAHFAIFFLAFSKYSFAEV